MPTFCFFLNDIFFIILKLNYTFLYITNFTFCFIIFSCIFQGMALNLNQSLQNNYFLFFFRKRKRKHATIYIKYFIIIIIFVIIYYKLNIM